MPSPQHPQPGQVEQPAQLPPPLLGSLHGYERMAALSDTGEDLTIPKVTRTVSQALTQTPKSAETDLAASDTVGVLDALRPQKQPLNSSQVEADKGANMASQETHMAFDQNTLCIPKVAAEASTTVRKFARI